MYAWKEIDPPKSYVRWHAAAGGRDLRLFMADAGSGFLRVILATEPAQLDPPRDYQRHLSVSFSSYTDGVRPTAKVNDHQSLHTVRHFFGRLKWSEESPEGMVRHFLAPLAYADAKPGDLLMSGNVRFRVSACVDGHVWGNVESSSVPGECCRVCGMMRRRDRKNMPCKGPARLELRGDDGPYVCEKCGANKMHSRLKGLRCPTCD